MPSEPQRSGDPIKGRQFLVDGAYITCGMPLSAYQHISPAPDPKQLLPDRARRNAGLPYMLTRVTSAAGVELVTSNCLTCHAAFFNDELIIGLGNEVADWTEDLAMGAESAGAYVDEPAAAAEWRKWADRISAIAPYAQTDTLGVNPANNFTLALIAHRDPETLAWSPEPLLQPPPRKPLPVSVPPWWRMKKKNALFYSTEGRGDHARFMMTAALLCTDSVEAARRIDRHAPDMRAFIASLEPPEYSWPIDKALAAEGRRVFEAHCSRCHGTYGENAAYPNRVIGLDEIGTDPELARRAVEDSDRFIRWYNRSFFGELARAAPAPGYIAPPLDGVWATAPYLHNGSVPSIKTLLDSQSRPVYWTRAFDSTDFNQQELGWNYRVLRQGKSAVNDWETRKRIYDTTLEGYANTGHTFGDALTDKAREAVLEYLKTL